MITFSAVGDSIGVGTCENSKIHCTNYAHVGWTSDHWDQVYHTLIIKDDITVISLGSNDWQKDKTIKALRSIRSRIKSTRVIWILPHNWSAELIYNLAKENHDLILMYKQASKNNIHPNIQEYKRLSNAILSN